MPERLTDARIEELLSLESKATQGEWIVSDDTCRVCREDGGEFNIDPVDGGMHGMFAGRDNPDFIAASRNSIRSLLEEVRERRKADTAEVERLQEREKPVRVKRSQGFKVYACSCGGYPDRAHKFCPHCGRKIEWK